MVDQAERLRELIRGTKPPGKRKATRVIAVTSGKGGVGKTNLAVNLGIALTQLGNRVLLVDADLGLANVDVILGIIPKYNLGHVLLGAKQIDEVVAEGPGGLKIVASGSGDYKLANLSERGLEQCLQHLNEIDQSTDIMIVDTGAGISRNVLKFVLAAAEVIIVTTPEPTAITDAYGIIKVVVSAAPTTPLWVVVNMVKNDKEADQVMDRLVSVSKRFLGVGLTGIGSIPVDPIVVKSVKEQQPFIVGHPRSAASQSVNQIAKNLLSKESPLQSSLQSGTMNFFERLLRRF